MQRSYSLYEAKARLSEIVRAVRERGESATITWHGEPVAEIRPLEKASGGGWAERLRQLEQRGVLRRVPVAGDRPGPVARRPGGLQRFLDERAE
jgi:prevent-host-death family protein